MDSRDDRKRYYNDSKMGMDDPPHSRLFIVCNKMLGEDDLRTAFSKFGEIDELWIVKDRKTGDSKGIAYVKFAKTSEAAAALESMNGKVIGNVNRPLKVMVAASPNEGAKRDEYEEEKLLRLFILVPKTATNEELQEVFKEYGDIHYVNIVRDKEKQESKGFAYIKYNKFSHAAAAFEQCDRKYRPVFAEPRRNSHSQEPSENFYPRNKKSSMRGNVQVPPPMDNNDETATSLKVITSTSLNQNHVHKLFDVIPGLEYCRSEVNPRTDVLITTIVYNNPRSALHAIDKLQGMEYPLGSHIVIKPEYNLPDCGGDSWGRESQVRFNRGEQSEYNQPSGRVSANSELMHLAETIAKATNIIQAAGYLPSDLVPSKKKETPKTLQCNVDLPDIKPIVEPDTEMVARLFIVCTPRVLPMHILKDVFCRFGFLIDIYLMPNRNCGYVKYASKQSAEAAIKTVHGAEIFGVRLKVMEAEEPENTKRMRMDYD